MATYTLKYPGHCRRCGKYLPAGTRVKWHHALGNECLECRFFAPQPTDKEKKCAAQNATTQSKPPEPKE